MAAIISICAYVGIDPGATTGICYMDRDRNARKLVSYNWGKMGANRIFRAVYAEMQEVLEKNDLDYKPEQAFVVVIETPTGGSYATKAAQLWAHARALGMNMERSDELGKNFEDAGFTVVYIFPKRGETKWNSAKFNSRFGWTGSSNEHSRDAGCHAARGIGEYSILLNQARAGVRGEKRRNKGRKPKRKGGK